MRRANSTLSAPPDPQNQSRHLDLVALENRLHLAALEDQRGRLRRSSGCHLPDQPVLRRRPDPSSLVEPAWSNQRLQPGRRSCSNSCPSRPTRSKIPPLPLHDALPSSMRRANSTLSAPPDPQNQSRHLDLVALENRLHLAALEDQR